MQNIADVTSVPGSAASGFMFTSCFTSLFSGFSLKMTSASFSIDFFEIGSFPFSTLK